jgi:uncharacterized RDD family membrane protein YckC
MLFNKRRQALHDFIAGTVVILDRKVPNLLPAAAHKANEAVDPAAGTLV